MRLLDRYLLSTFLAALGVFAAAFVTLFLAIDFASKLGKFFELQEVSLIPFILHYYMVRLPMVAAYLLPMVVLFAAIFTVVKLARTNELLPMVASGTSLRRVSAPFFVTAALAALTMATMDEFILSRLGNEITETDDILSNREVSWGVSDFRDRTSIYASHYDHIRRRMSNVRIKRLDDEARAAEVVRAATCNWDPERKHWVAKRGTIEYPSPVNASPRTEPIDPEGYVVMAGSSPLTISPNSAFTSKLPFAPLATLLEQARLEPDVPAFRVKVHSRFTFPLSPLVLLLLGLPFVATAPRTSLIKGLFFCFALSVAYYITHFAALDLGNRGDADPMLAVWTPTALFSAAGLAAFARMRT